MWPPSHVRTGAVSDLMVLRRACHFGRMAYRMALSWHILE